MWGWKEVNLVETVFFLLMANEYLATFKGTE